jgi:hypothetical protein
LVAGATVALKDTAAQAVKNAHSGLKAVLEGRFSMGSVWTLEKDPTDEMFKGGVEREVGLTPELLADPEVKKFIAELYSAIEGKSRKRNLEALVSI